MSSSTPVVAVDFGAASIRVCRLDVAAPRPRLQLLHRAAHQPVRDAAGTLRWDWPRLLRELHVGLDRALELGPVASIGIDTWGVDYGLIDAAGDLVEPPVSYRDGRTAGYRAVVERIGEERLFAISGLQLMPINTVFQVAAHDPDMLNRARHLLLLPELIVHHLTGEVTAELTSAGTTGLLDVTSGDWSAELADAVGLPMRLLSPLRRPGTLAGTWRGIPVRLVGGHDTASAVLGGARDGAAFVSAGTWLLVGRTQPKPDLSEWARSGGFTNEQGATGDIRLLRNVTGWWLVEECRRQWGDPDLDTLLDEAAEVGEVSATDATDERFLAPADMPAELAAATGLEQHASRAVIVRCALESMARSTAAVLDQLDLPAVQVFGGGSRSPLLIELLRRHSGREVTVGPVEATALGNVISQSLAMGVFDSVSSAREMLAAEDTVAASLGDG